MTQAIELHPRPVVARPIARKLPPLTHVATAELVECTCPDACERDHDRD
jgi:hypothetical protein